MRSKSKRTIKSMLFRVVSIGLGLLAIVVLEGVLRIFGLGGGGVAEDPFVGFSAMRPLFELNEAGDEFETALKRLGLGLTPDQIDQCIEVLDKDGDGEVSLEEFMGLVRSTNQSSTILRPSRTRARIRRYRAKEAASLARKKRASRRKRAPSTNKPRSSK